MSDAGGRVGPDFDLAAHPEGAWIVPIELVLAAKTSSAYPGVIYKRMQRQIWPAPDALVFIQDKRFFAVARFPDDGRPRLLWELDLWPVANLIETMARKGKRS